MIELLAVILISAVVLWILTQIPMDGTLQTIARALIIGVVAIYIILFVLSLFGAGMPSIGAWPRLGHPCP